MDAGTSAATLLPPEQSVAVQKFQRDLATADPAASHPEWIGDIELALLRSALEARPMQCACRDPRRSREAHLRDRSPGGDSPGTKSDGAGEAPWDGGEGQPAGFAQIR
jgi:hypothetical protein